MQQCSNDQVERIISLFKLFMKRFREIAFMTFKEHGFTVAQCSLISILHYNPNLMLNELSERMGLSKGTVSAIVERMERQGIVIREIPKDNRRIVRLSLSQGFVKNHKDLLDLRNKVANEIFKFQDLTVEGADQIINALELMTNGIK